MGSWLGDLIDRIRYRHALEQGQQTKTFDELLQEAPSMESMIVNRESWEMSDVLQKTLKVGYHALVGKLSLAKNGDDETNRPTLDWRTAFGKRIRFEISPELEQCMAAARSAQECPESQKMDGLPEMALYETFLVRPGEGKANYRVYPPGKWKALFEGYVRGPVKDCER